MQKLILRTVAIVASIASTVVLFQNCGKSFTLADTAVTVDSSSLSTVDNHQTPHIVPVSMKIEANTDIEFSVSADSLLPSISYQWSHTLNNVPAACTLKNSNQATSYIINCSQAGTLNVSVTVMEGNTPLTLPVYTALLAGTPASTGEINLQVIFNIPAGTGSAPWNTTSTVVETFIGQTLKFVNMDSIPHQIHTNGAPCPHGSAMASGASTNCVIAKAYDYKTNGILYDHQLGTKSAFYMVAYDGSALYTKNCAGCHNALSMSSKAGAKVSTIKRALMTVQDMKSNANLMSLTQRQIEAISFALGAK